MAWNGTTRGRHGRRSGRYESDLTDGEWAVIEPLLSPPSRLGRRRTTDLREAFNAARYMLATGCQWRALPKCFPPSATVRNHFHSWRDSGVSGRMPGAPRTLARARAGRDAQPTAAAIDSQSVRTTGTGGPSGYDAGRKVRGSRRHLTVDAGGFPIAVRVHGADARDRDGALAVILAMLEKAPQVTKPLADGGYAGPGPRAALAEQGLGSIVEIVQRPRETRGFTVLYHRWAAARQRRGPAGRGGWPRPPVSLGELWRYRI